MSEYFFLRPDIWVCGLPTVGEGISFINMPIPLCDYLPPKFYRLSSLVSLDFMLFTCFVWLPVPRYYTVSLSLVFYAEFWSCLSCYPLAGVA